ncbi:MAG: type II toxin-antitoxin system Phd/YefM family antitoxin [Deltaproteobacteria bacterium]|nr:type II toxin-antitoxin system Phd/YefM family antitoxin [Deltaproteobacteria bacterium]
MKASVVDLRYKMKDVLQALERREEVSILYHGKVKGRIVPAGTGKRGKVSDHPFFGMDREGTLSVESVMQNLRKERFDAI